MTGTLVNIATVAVGSSAGLLIGPRLPDRIKNIVINALGLITLWIGVDMVVDGRRPLLIVIAIVLGAITGEVLGIEHGLARFAEWLRTRVGSETPHFVLGFVSASLLFCVGPMTVVGSLEDGMQGDPTLLVTKAIMDGFAAMALSSSLGIGVLFSIITILVVQGGLTLVGSYMRFALEPNILHPLTAVGGIIILGLGLRLLKIREIPVANFLPGLVYIVFLAYFF